MRVLIISPYFYPHIGGSQQYMEELWYKVKKQIPDTQIDVLCYSTHKASVYEEYRGLQIYRLPCIQLLPGQFAVPDYIKLLLRIRYLKSQNRYTIVHSNTRFFESSWWAPFVARYLGAISVLTDHCANFPTHPSKFVSVIARCVDKFLVPHIARMYDVITVTNKATERFVQSLGVKQPIVVFGGVDTDFFHPRQMNNVRVLPKLQTVFTPDDIIVTFVGRMIYSKGPQLLMEVAKEIVKSKQNIYFIFAGDGEMYHKLRSQLSKQIVFMGSLEKKDIALLLSQTDILVHPSLHHEGFPNVLLEAGASGCAVIASDSGGTNEIVIHNQTGLLIRPTYASIQKAVVELIENRTKRRDLQETMRAHIEKNFDWKKVAIDFMNVIHLHGKIQ